MKRAPTKADLTAEFVRSLLDYDPLTGIFTWAKRRPRIVLGSRSGWLRKDGYRSIMIGGRDYKEQRLAWLFMYGEWPALDVDHIDGNRSNNSISNLRQATRSQNCMNATRMGYSLRKDNKKFVAYINVNGRRIHLGTHEDEDEARRAYREASIKHFGEFSWFEARRTSS